MRHRLQQPLILFILALLLTLIAGEPPLPPSIPFIDPHGPYGWPNMENVYYKRSYSIRVKPDKAALKKCLYGSSAGRFYDSWLDEVCEGYGWFKGVYREDISPYDCYQTCCYIYSLSGD